MIDAGVPGPHHAGRGQPVAGGRRRVLRHGGRARVPHVLPLPGDAAHLLRDHATSGRGRSSTSSRTPRRSRAGAQWSTFLRNHDELTLEMVSTEERASMYGWYAPDPRMRANIGIRRRLAPLLDNSRKEIELAQRAAALAARAAPCLYYGDEIGMGDNIWLPDRDAVRTPMQWTPDRNAGFSTADPGKLYLPLVQSLVQPLQPRQRRGAARAADVAAALGARHARGPAGATPRSGTGDFTALDCDNESVLALPAHHAGRDGPRASPTWRPPPRSATHRAARLGGRERSPTSSAAPRSPR